VALDPRTHRRLTRLGMAVALAGMAVAGAACGGDDGSPVDAGSASSSAPTTGPAATAPAAATATREILGRIPAPEAPGYDQYLLRVTIPPGVALPAHHHPGLEVAHITQGELTYTIIEGTAPIGRAGAEGPTEEATAPAEVTLAAGDTVYEHEDMHHAAANRGDDAVVVLLASLIESGQPITVNDP
jgi:quercetin dioxygenase-like cupin family protein